MGQVIEGPWMRRDGSQLVGQLDQELRRMTVVLEKVREGHARETALTRQSQPHQATEDSGQPNVQPRSGVEG